MIFYAGHKLTETIIEMWDPLFSRSKPSIVYRLEQAPPNTPLPTRREDARVLVMENML